MHVTETDELAVLMRNGADPATRIAIAESRQRRAQEEARQHGDALALAELAELRQRVAALEHTLSPDGDFVVDLVEGIGSVLPRFVDKRMRELLPALTGNEVARINALEEELAAVKARPALFYKGVWQADHCLKYSGGDAVTLEGSLWIATGIPSARPGTPDSGWTLAVKRGAVSKAKP
jgi:hypothetical protein